MRNSEIQDSNFKMVLVACLLLSACAPVVAAPAPGSTPVPTETPVLNPLGEAAQLGLPGPTPLPTRGPLRPGEPLSYVVQSGDTVRAIAAHFNTTVEEVLAANPGLPQDATLSPGLAITVPAYYFSLGGPAFKMIPDGELVYGPATAGFDLAAYLASQPGYLKNLSAYVADRQRTSAQTILYVAQHYSINPRLLLALMEWRTGALTQTEASSQGIDRPFGPLVGAGGFYSQLRWAAEQLSIGYYGWRSGDLTILTLREGYQSRVDMYQNAGTVGVQYLIAQLVPYDQFDVAVGPDGFAATYYKLWGNPFDSPPEDVIPGNLVQPEWALPFAANQQWALTGGPHPGWGQNLPWSALDFAPPAGETGCINTDKRVLATAPGVVVRSGDNTVVLDLDGDGQEGTGWALIYFHLAGHDLIAAGQAVQAGDPVGHPSCEGGVATGTHVHIARKYNGEWLAADGIVPGVIPFTLGGWVPVRGNAPYSGRMTRIGAWVEACTCSTATNRVYWAP